jgi:hypothetical protein
MNAAAEAPLLFNWGPPRARARALVVFIAASLFLHALCFYVFQIVYPPTVVLLPPPARVSLITASSSEGRALLQWIDAEDPALASATVRPPEAKSRMLPKLQHIPSYINERAALKEVPPLIVDLRPPSAQPPGPAPMINREAAPANTISPTGVAFSEEISGIGAAKFPATKFNASTNEQPDNVRFRVAINARGEIQYCFPLNSSGDASLNEQARQHIALTRFPARSTLNNEALVWGIATVEWGNDVARPATRASSAEPTAAKSTSTPPPP